MGNNASVTIPATIAVGGIDLIPLDIEGERVVTLAMIDEVHQRPDGTAGRNFRENRERFIEGKHYFELSADEIRRRKMWEISSKARGDIILLTERGYLMLVKSFTDDLAWQVQDALVENYFAKPAAPMTLAIHPGAGREARLSFKQNLQIAKMVGFTGNQAMLAANKATLAMTGVDTLGLMGAAHLPAPDNDALLTPTEIGRRTGIGSARVVNMLLSDIGLQHSFRDARSNLYYELTEAGKDAGGVMLDTGKKHGTGAPIRQLKWPSSILSLVQDGAA